MLCYRESQAERFGDLPLPRGISPLENNKRLLGSRSGAANPQLLCSIHIAGTCLGSGALCTPNQRTKNLNFRGFDSIIFSCIRGGFPLNDLDSPQKSSLWLLRPVDSWYMDWTRARRSRGPAAARLGAETRAPPSVAPWRGRRRVWWPARCWMSAAGPGAGPGEKRMGSNRRDVSDASETESESASSPCAEPRWSHNPMEKRPRRI